MSNRPSTGPFGSFGDTPATLQNSHFFRWFNFARIDDAAEDVDVYGPRNPTFHPFARLLVRRGWNGRLSGLTLRVARDFIDDQHQAPYARDLIKSFCLAAAEPTAELTALADELMFRDAPGPLIARGRGPFLPSQPSPVFLIVAGKEDTCRLTSGLVEITLSNGSGPPAGVVIDVTRTSGAHLRRPLAARAWGLLRSPDQAWTLIETEPQSAVRLLLTYVAPLAAIGPMCRLISAGLTAMMRPDVGFPLNLFIIGLAIDGLSILRTFVLSLIINELAPRVFGTKDRIAALKVAAYASTPVWIAGILRLVPTLAPLMIVAEGFSLYLLYGGLRRLMRPRRDKMLSYTIATALFDLCLGGLFTLLPPEIARWR